jgi:penicillin-binding protein 1A
MSARRERQRRRRSQRGAGRLIFLTFGVTLIVLALSGLSAVGYVYGIAASAPDIGSLKAQDPGQNSIVYAADGQRLGIIESDIARDPIPSTEIPQTMNDATVAIEDRRFYDHDGVDFEGVIRAATKNLRSGETVEGGSTLTMQLISTLYVEDEGTYKFKIREAKLAEELENVHNGPEGKKWILTKYINSVPYGTVGGQTALGVQAAARIYFDKPASELKVHESALLAGLPQAPSLYNPFLEPERAKNRRDEVLRQMAEQGYIAESTAQEAIARDLGVQQSRYFRDRRESYFFDYVRDELIQEYGVRTVRAGGLRVKTTINPRLQREARAVMEGNLGDPARAAAIVSVDPRSGAIKAMASSRSYQDSKFNLAADGKRQPGSTFKTMALMAALDRGVSPSTSYTSKPLKFNDPQWGPIDVETYGRSYAGSTTLQRATLSSDNSVYMQLALDVGPENVEKAARQMGIKSRMESVPSETLGGLARCCSPLEMANSYATIASGGWRNRPKSITEVRFPDGRTEDLAKPRRHKAFSDGVAFEATKILKQNVTSGTGTAANIGCPVAGKTGTAEAFADAWFVGYTPALSTAFWMGHPRERVPMPGVAGGTIPARLWGEYMRKAKGDFCGDFPQPKEPFQAQPFSGRYSRSAPPGGGGRQGSQDSLTSPSEGIGGRRGGQGGGGNGAFDPELYEAPPQAAPTPAPAADAPSEPSGGATPGE